MSDIVKVGIIGCGGMGSHHAQNLAKIDRAALRGFADVHLESAQKLQNEFGCDYCTRQAQDLFHDDQIDLVLICTHHDLHVPLAIQAAEAGKQIFVEKPRHFTAITAHRQLGFGASSLQSLQWKTYRRKPETVVRLMGISMK